MKNPVLVSLILITCAFIVSCGNNATKQEESKENHDHTTTEVKAEAVQVNDPVLNAVYQQYLKLNLALVNNNENDAKIAANTLELGASELENNVIITKNASKITEAATLKEMRDSFSELSNALISMIKISGLKSGEIYVDYCPMALNDHGAYWLSSEKGIKNPYFGDRMLTCGETKETII